MRVFWSCLTLFFVVSCALTPEFEEQRRLALIDAGLDKGSVEIAYSIDSSCGVTSKITLSNPKGLFDEDAMKVFEKHIVEERENYVWNEVDLTKLTDRINAEVPNYRRARLEAEDFRVLTNAEYKTVLEVEAQYVDELIARGQEYRRTIKLVGSEYRKLRCFIDASGQLTRYDVLIAEGQPWEEKSRIPFGAFEQLKFRYTMQYDY